MKGATILKYVAAVGIPAAVIVLVAGNKRSTLPTPSGGPMPSSIKPTKRLADYFRTEQVPPRVVQAPMDPNAEVAGWYKFQDLWIRVDIYPDSRIEDSDDIVVIGKMRFKARFRWSVMLSDDVTPLATDVVTKEGTSWSLSDNTDAMLLEAEEEAYDKVVNDAVAWIITSGLRKIV